MDTMNPGISIVALLTSKNRDQSASARVDVLAAKEQAMRAEGGAALIDRSLLMCTTVTALYSRERPRRATWLKMKGESQNYGGGGDLKIGARVVSNLLQNDNLSTEKHKIFCLSFSTLPQNSRAGRYWYTLLSPFGEDPEAQRRISKT